MFALWSACNEALLPRIKSESGLFQHGHTQQRLFVFPRKHDRRTGGLTHHLDDPKTDFKLLPGPVGQFVGAATRWFDPGSAQSAGGGEDDVYYVIHARGMTDNEKRQLRRRRR